MNKFYQHLLFLYGSDRAADLAERLTEKLEVYRARLPEVPVPSPERVSEKDAILITYGDMVQTAGERPLQTLADFFETHLSGLVSSVHFLPCFPYSSDDGFSVIDYYTVDPALGDWEDVARFGQNFRLMFDDVANHISAHSEWFAKFKEDDPEYRHFFTVVEPDTDLSAVFRPRTLPLLTAVTTKTGDKHVWTTFSADQIDLNYAEPDVLFAMLDVLLFYVEQGAEFIRLDAIAYIWKEIGTSCIHLPEAHEIIKLMRSVLNEVAPQVSLITETNVPHKDNISYFGDGTDEAQMVYNFSLPPLTLHAFHTGNAEILSQWASSLELPSDEVTFFNFLASHDGIGVQPAKGLLSETAVAEMADRVQKLGGLVSFKANGDGTKSAYELNINYLDALGDPNIAETDELKAKRFLAAQAIMLAMRGVPGIYFHSMFGSQNWVEGVAETGRSRTINRQKLQKTALDAELRDVHSLRHFVFSGYQKLLQARTNESAFHPNAKQEVISLHPSVFAFWRVAQDGRSQVLCLHNVSNESVMVELPTSKPLTDVISHSQFEVDEGDTLFLEPYDVLWLADGSGFGAP